MGAERDMEEPGDLPKKRKHLLASDSACSQDECHTPSERLELEVQVVRINKNQANL